MNKTVFLNGKFIPQEKAKISILSAGFLYGWGVFESMRSYRNNIVYFNEHLERLNRSAKLLDIGCGFSLSKLKEIIYSLVGMNSLKDAYIRLTLSKCEKGQDVLITAKKYEPYSPRKYKKGFRVCVSCLKQNESSCLTRIKTTNYLLCRLAYTHAIKIGFDDAIILNSRGYITEASRSNLFFVKGEELLTPSLECGCLEGITRRFILELSKKYNIKAFQGNFSVSDLCGSDAAFLTNSLMGIMPLASLEGTRIGKERGTHKITRLFMERYKALLRNEL